MSRASAAHPGRGSLRCSPAIRVAGRGEVDACAHAGGEARTESIARRYGASGWIAGVALGAVFIWTFWPTLVVLWNRWQNDSDYSAGQLVPLVAACAVWLDRAALRALPVRVCWWGLAVLITAQVWRCAGLLLHYGSAEQYSVLLSLAGAVLFVFGYPVCRRLAWVWVFLLLLVPLPHRVHEMVSLPLQEFATKSAVFGLEMAGYLVAREGNVLRLSDQGSIAVAEACSGLRMMTAFVVVGAALAFVIRRPAWEKAVLVLSTLPIAILANTARLIVTAVIYETAGSDFGDRFFHDFAGITMMPFAFLALVGELYVMKYIAAPLPRDAARA